MVDSFEAIDNLASKLEKMIKKASDPQKILEKGADAFVKDVRKLPKPFSKIHKSGYTHLIHTIDYVRARGTEVEVGSKTKYYLRFLEPGTYKMGAKPFLRPQYERNKQKYIDIMSTKTPSQEQKIGNLSGGNQQKVMIGRWLAAR